MFKLSLVLLGAVGLFVVSTYVAQQRYVLVGMAMGTYRVYDSQVGRVYELPLNPNRVDPKMENEAQPPGNPKTET